MRSGTMLQLLDDAIGIANKMALIDVRVAADAESQLKQEAISLLGYLRALEAVLKQEAVNSRAQQANQEPDDAEVRKVEKRLKLWSRKPQQINSLILTCYLRLRHEEGVDPVSVDLLRERYNRERGKLDNKEFDANFWLMRMIGRTNHGKIFEVDARNVVTIWPRVQAAVERFRKDGAIGMRAPRSKGKAELQRRAVPKGKG